MIKLLIFCKKKKKKFFCKMLVIHFITIILWLLGPHHLVLTRLFERSRTLHFSIDSKYKYLNVSPSRSMYNLEMASSNAFKDTFNKKKIYLICKYEGETNIYIFY